jgi:hypothetical protein
MMFDQDILAAALIGLELKMARLEDQIAAVRAMTTGGKKVGRPRKVVTASDDWEEPAVAETPKKAKKKGTRNLSPEARARIASAQKKRWAAARGEAV